jgi:hypothetical protein
MADKYLTHPECDKTVRGFRAEIEALKCELGECPTKYERAMQDRATAEQLDVLEQKEIALEKKLHNLTVARVNDVAKMSDDFQPQAQKRDREAFDKVCDAELRFKEGEIRRAQESAAEKKAWDEANVELQRVRSELQTIQKVMAEFLQEFIGRTRKRAADRREKRAQELAAVTGA